MAFYLLAFRMMEALLDGLLISSFGRLGLLGGEIGLKWERILPSKSALSLRDASAGLAAVISSRIPPNSCTLILGFPLAMFGSVETLFSAPVTTPENEMGTAILDIAGSALVIVSCSNRRTACPEKLEVDTRMSLSICGLLPEPPVFTILAMFHHPSFQAAKFACTKSPVALEAPVSIGMAPSVWCSSLVVSYRAICFSALLGVKRIFPIAGLVLANFAVPPQVSTLLDKLIPVGPDTSALTAEICCGAATLTFCPWNVTVPFAWMRSAFELRTLQPPSS